MFPALQARYDVVIVEEAAPTDGAWLIEQKPGRWLLHSDGIRKPLPCPPRLEVLEPYPAELASLPAWPSKQPRCGVVSLPHLAGFSGWTQVRGAEWLTAPGVGQFDFLFLPATTDPLHDADWLAERGMPAWLSSQKAAGCRVIAAGWRFEGAELVEPETIPDTRRLGVLMGLRWPEPLPGAEELSRLAAWLERGLGRDRLRALLP